jgi:carbamoyltransferase
VLREHAADYFEIEPEEESPYMMLVAPVQERWRVAPTGSSATGLERVREVRSVVPAVTHVDHSARIQTVDNVRNPRLHRLLEAFRRLTGCPVMINTSFNIRGEPIVCTAADALRCFLATDMDALVIGDFLLLRSEQPERPAADSAAYRASFGDD